MTTAMTIAMPSPRKTEPFRAPELFHNDTEFDGNPDRVHATRDEVDREVEKIARQQREPVAALHIKFEKDGTLGRIASQIQTDKTLNYLFEHARKTA